MKKELKINFTQTGKYSYEIEHEGEVYYVRSRPTRRKRQGGKFSPPTTLPPMMIVGPVFGPEDDI